ncbi:MAG TPA: ArsA family ATPase [Ornithinimicrobium sp.]|uniref:ArsA family ATPase n=1 Tax=Ornithinimicrobium sp. TaxID=1977084 RepID=UPI002B45A419|nr:ArsA family ATPase [Ornithinimicrobium sp.]HKJ11405.1 ArsA family ATPase [Ornithinimicrobium sp.]
MLLELIGGREVVFVGGKGGVGKTSVAGALALSSAEHGRRVLLVSTDPAHSLGHLFGMPVGDGFTEVVPGLDACELDPERTMDIHLDAAERTMRRLMPEHLGAEVTKHLTLAREAPGAAEAAVLERLADVLEGARQAYDRVVVDTAPSGHTVRLLGLPQVVTAWTSGLLGRQQRSARFAEAMSNLDRGHTDADPGAELVPRRGRRGARGRPSGSPEQEDRQARDAEIRDILLRRQARFTHLRSLVTDPSRSAFVVVLAAERLPVQETVELHEHLRRLGASVDGLVVNKRSPRGQGELLDRRRAQEEEHLSTLTAALPRLPLTQVPLLADDVHGVASLRRLGDLL